jgi:large subunit ribosomal protein L17
MRHGKKFNHLSRKSAHRKAMLSNMASSLIEHKRIRTTVAKAKALKLYVEPLITKSKTDSTHSRRVVFSYLQNKESIKELFGAVAEKVANRPGGYTRILRLGNRPGDNAEMCYIELVDFNENMLKDAKKPVAKTTRRSRRGGGAKKATEAVTETSATKAEATKETAPKKKAAPKAGAKSEEAPKEDAPKAKAKKEEPKSEDKGE